MVVEVVFLVECVGDCREIQRVFRLQRRICIRYRYGIGLMIVFMACILVAAITSAVIIQAVEKLAQQTQHTVHDANKESANQMIILNVWVEDSYDDYLFMIEYQSMGKEAVF